MKRDDSILISLSILSWGFLTDNLMGGVVMSMIIIGLSFISLRWKIFDNQFHTITDLTSLAFVLSSLYIFYAHGEQAIYRILETAPYCGYLLILLQQANFRSDVPMSSFQYKLRKNSKSQIRVNITPHYFLCCLFAMSTSNNRFLCLIFTLLLFGGYLLTIRVRSYKGTIFSVLATIGLVLSFLLIQSFLPVYNAISDKISQHVSPEPWWRSNPNRFITSIGQIHMRKLSDDIRIRIKDGKNHIKNAPIYLTQSVFDKYNLTAVWEINNQTFGQVDKTLESDEWIVNTEFPMTPIKEKEFEIIMRNERDLLIMPVPSNIAAIKSKNIVELSSNKYMNLRGEAQSGHVNYTAITGPANLGSPLPSDLLVPKPYTKLFKELLVDTGINDLSSDNKKVELLKKFLHRKYAYNYPSDAVQTKQNTLATFLKYSKKGHCEHFATAATLMLRQAGIPSKYVVGYVVNEWSELESALIARDRHAHAWTVAYLNDTWVTLDFTPPIWEKEEARLTEYARQIRDFLSFIFYRLDTLESNDFKSIKPELIIIITLLVAILIFRLLRSPQIIRKQDTINSELIQDRHVVQMMNLIDKLEKVGLGRTRNETVAMMLDKSHVIGIPKKVISNLIKSYYQLRFSEDRAAVNRFSFQVALMLFSRELRKKSA